MPTYQYACTNPEGKHAFEVVQSFTDAAVSECPECGASVRKVYGSVGVVFKGSGFYRTDSRTKTPAGSSSSDGSSGKDGSMAKDGSPGKDGSSSSKEGASAKEGASSTKSSSASGSGAKAAS